LATAHRVFTSASLPLQSAIREPAGPGLALSTPRVRQNASPSGSAHSRPSSLSPCSTSAGCAHHYAAAPPPELNSYGTPAICHWSITY